MRNFVTPHCHVMSLDSASTPEAFAKREVELETGAITATDHGSLAAIYRIYELAKKNKLIAIPGIEAYFRDDNCPILTKLGVPKTDVVPRGMDKDKWAIDHPTGSFYSYNKYYHITLGFKTYDAYLKGVKLLSKADDRAETHGSERKPLFDWSDLEELAATQTTIGSGCLVGMVSRHLIKSESPAEVKLGAAKAYFERLLHLFGDRMFVEVFPHVCDREYSKGVFIEVGDGEAKKTLKFYYGKTLKTEEGECKAEQLADKWNDKKKLNLLATKDFGKWNDLEPLSIVSVRKHEGFIQNECSPAAPEGDVQWGVNAYMMRMAKKYNLPILCSDDCHFALPAQKIVQDVKLSQMGDWRFYGCFESKTPVDMADGSKKPISEIKPGDMVKSYDFSSNRVVAARVKAVIPTKATRDSFVCHEFLGYGGKGQRPAITSTPNHAFWTGSAWTPIKECKTPVAIRAPAPNAALLEVIDGVMLGDGSVSFAGRRGETPYFSYAHAESQRELTKIVGDYMSANFHLWQTALYKYSFKNKQKTAIVNSAHPLFGAVRARWYPNGKKEIPKDLVLTPRSLAWWYLDDGSRCVGPRTRADTEQYRLYTNGFTKNDVTWLIEQLSKLGCHGRMYEYGHGPFIAFSKGAAHHLQELIAPYVPPTVQYKLAPKYRGRYVEDKAPQFIGETIYCMAKKRSRGLPTKKPEIITHTKYDIEVEDYHCFFVWGLLVHNSYHRKSSEEAFEHFKAKHGTTEAEFEGWIENSYAFRDSFKDFKFDSTLQLPTRFYPQDTLAHTKKLIEKHGRFPKNDPRYAARLKQEIELFHRNGTVDLLPYFFTCEEQCQVYENQGVLVGSSRGSAGGVLLSYLLGITSIDPIQHNLSLDRFLTLDRITSRHMPDIDLDFSSRELLCGKECDVIEVESEDGTKHVLPEDFCIETEKGVVPVKRAIQEGLEFEKWW